MPADRVRVVIPDMGGGFGGKHSPDAALEAARLGQGGWAAGVRALDSGRGIHLGLFPAGSRHRVPRRTQTPTAR